jgi:hypothetical protein
VYFRLDQAFLLTNLSPPWDFHTNLLLIKKDWIIFHLNYGVAKGSRFGG